jgi:hypothetical protein
MNQRTKKRNFGPNVEITPIYRLGTNRDSGEGLDGVRRLQKNKTKYINTTGIILINNLPGGSGSFGCSCFLITKHKQQRCCFPGGSGSFSCSYSLLRNTNNNRQHSHLEWHGSKESTWKSVHPSQEKVK